MKTPSVSGNWTLPDLYLTVRKISNDGEPALDYDLLGNKLGLPKESMGVVPCAGYQNAIESTLEVWEQHCREHSVSPGQALNSKQLRQKGARLFETVLPLQLQKHLWQLRFKATSLMIECSEEIPWELFHLQDPDSDAEDDYLCLRFQLTRWISSSKLNSSILYMPALHFRMAPMALIQGSTQDLRSAKAELNHLEDHHSTWKPEHIESSWNGINGAMTSARFNAWHFVGHGSRGAAKGKQMSMILDSDEELSPDILGGSSRSAGRLRPIVFWNCCYSTRSTQLFGLRGWPESFLRHGFGGFLGTMWAVGDQAAFTFSKTFYAELAEGNTVGDALHSARLEVKNEGSHDWLAYAYYGDPRARVKLSESTKLAPKILMEQLPEANKAAHHKLLAALNAIKEPVPPQILAQFARVTEEQVLAFRDYWAVHLQESNQETIFPRSSLRKALKAWSQDGLLDIASAHKHIVQTLLEKVYGKKI